MQIKKVLLITIATWILAIAHTSTATAQTIVFVNASATSGNNSGTSWTNAYLSLESALAEAHLPGHASVNYDIRIASGTYLPTNLHGGTNTRDATFAITRPGIKIYGGYDGNTGIRNITGNPTTLSGNIGALNNSGDNSFHVMVIVGIPYQPADSVIVDGITVTAGNANSGGNIVLNAQQIQRFRAGGIHTIMVETNTVIRNCIIERNNAINGGGMYTIEVKHGIINCIFAGNTSMNGGALYIDGSSFGSALPIINSIFSGNVSTGPEGGAAIYSRLGNFQLINSVLQGNTASGSSATGGGIFIHPANQGIPELKNSIVWDNIANSDANISGAATVSYSNIQQPIGVYAGEGNINSDPQFLNINDPDGADNIWRSPDDGLRLVSCSPSINAGTPDIAGLALGETDIAYAARIQMGRVDMGAYETEGNEGEATVSEVSATNRNLQSSALSTIYANSCNNIIAAIMGNGTVASIQGITETKVWIEGTPPATWVKRHYEIMPTTNPATTTGRVTLYFTQEDFDDFNNLNLLKLPEHGDDTPAKSHVRIEKQAGHSEDGSGLPESYGGATEVIDPSDTDVLWNVLANRWEISFNVTGFGGFFLKSSNVALPLMILGFEVKRQRDISVLSWKTANEHNIHYFEVQRSTNGQVFETFATVQARNGQLQTYTYEDMASFSERIFYRLKVNELDGVMSYSKVVTLAGGKKTQTKIFPNPVKNIFTISINDKDLLNTLFSITDAKGVIVLQQKIQADTQPVNISALLPGIYFIRFADGEVKSILKE